MPISKWFTTSQPAPQSGLATNWGAVIRTIIQAFEDYKANKQRPASEPPSGAQLADSARKLQSALPVIIAWLDAHPGAVTAADDILEALRSGGLTWASDAENAVNGAPSAFATAESWLPTLIGLLTAFQPAPIGIPGGWSGARGHVRSEGGSTRIQCVAT